VFLCVPWYQKQLPVTEVKGITGLAIPAGTVGVVVPVPVTPVTVSVLTHMILVVPAATAAAAAGTDTEIENRNNPPPRNHLWLKKLLQQLPWQISIHGFKKNASLGGRDILRRRHEGLRSKKNEVLFLSPPSWHSPYKFNITIMVK